MVGYMCVMAVVVVVVVVVDDDVGGTTWGAVKSRGYYLPL